MSNEKDEKDVKEAEGGTKDTQEDSVPQDGIAELILGAKRHVEFCAKIAPPIDPEADRIVGELVARRCGYVKTRPLTRRHITRKGK